MNLCMGNDPLGSIFEEFSDNKNPFSKDKKTFTGRFNIAKTIFLLKSNISVPQRKYNTLPTPFLKTHANSKLVIILESNRVDNFNFE